MDRKRSAPDADSGSKLTLTFGGGGAKKKPKKKRSRRSRGEAAAAPPAVQVAADVDDDGGDDAAETNAQVELLLDAPGGLDVTADFTPMQLRRYEKFRRSAFARAKLKRLVQDAGSEKQACSDKVAIVVQAVAKTLVGELVETGRDVMLEWGDEGPLRPRHVQEAHRRLLAQGSVLRERPARAFMR